MVDKDLAVVLTAVGFDEKEAGTYLSLLELGKASVAQIAAHAELKRPIVYYVLERLIKNGFAQEIPGTKVRLFAAVDPSRILYKTQTATEELRFMLPLMRALYDKGADRPKIEYFEGREAIITVYRLFEKRKQARFLTSIKRLDTIMPQEVESWVRRYEEGRSKDKMQATLISDSTIDLAWGKRVVQAGQKVRIIPTGMNADMDFSIVDDILSITSFDPLFIVVIHSEQIARSAAALFDLAWESGKEIT
jgi:sugar-specific transcriptional regulator TrmB